LPELPRLEELYREEIIIPREKLSLHPLKRPKNAWINRDDTWGVGIDAIDEHNLLRELSIAG
jgi:hypothetical protein